MDPVEATSTWLGRRTWLRSAILPRLGPLELGKVESVGAFGCSKL